MKKIAASTCLLLLAACDLTDRASAGSGPLLSSARVDQARLGGAAREPGNWLTHGGTYLEQRYAALDQINDRNVGDLKLAWYYEFDTNRGQEATPIVVDGVMYTTSAWSKVYALDAATGKELWSYDPAVIGAKAAHACCDVVNRGVAVYDGKVFFGTIDGRLIALNAKTGKPVWSRVTIDQKQPYTITGAPRVVKGRIVIGNSGAELGVRGYVSAYDAQTGNLAWRFYTVPGNPTDVPDGAASDDALARIAEPTWSGQWWKLGGGGTVWDAIVYDPELDQLYIGVGNGSPWNHRVRSEGKGDNLFLASIVALDPDTGAYKWHYQNTPGETWDFTATQQITLATLPIDGKPTKVLMQAPKNGFFYVIDRTNGKLISAKNFVPTTWATHIDPKTGRPVEARNARFAEGPFLSLPSGIGAHAWQPMAFSPKTGLVYIPAMSVPLTYLDNSAFKINLGRWNTAVTFTEPPDIPGLPADRAARRKAVAAMTHGHLLAWNPVRQKESWRIPYDRPWNGGVLATAGNLVFQGNARGAFQAFRADTGAKLWSFNAPTGVMAGPVSYMVNGEQYVAVLAGYGGSMGIASPLDEKPRVMPNGMVLAFKLSGAAKLPPYEPAYLPPANPPTEQFSAVAVALGERHYHTFCAICHTGVVTPDLRRSPMLADASAWREVVVGGALEAGGMASFASYLSPEDAEAIRAYVVGRARELQRQEASQR